MLKVDLFHQKLLSAQLDETKSTLHPSIALQNFTRVPITKARVYVVQTELWETIGNLAAQQQKLDPLERLRPKPQVHRTGEDMDAHRMEPFYHTHFEERTLLNAHKKGIYDMVFSAFIEPEQYLSNPRTVCDLIELLVRISKHETHRAERAEHEIKAIAKVITEDEFDIVAGILLYPEADCLGDAVRLTLDQISDLFSFYRRNGGKEKTSEEKRIQNSLFCTISFLHEDEWTLLLDFFSNISIPYGTLTDIPVVLQVFVQLLLWYRHNSNDLDILNTIRSVFLNAVENARKRTQHHRKEEEASRSELREAPSRDFAVNPQVMDYESHAKLESTHCVCIQMAYIIK